MTFYFLYNQRGGVYHTCLLVRIRSQVRDVARGLLVFDKGKVSLRSSTCVQSKY